MNSTKMSNIGQIPESTQHNYQNDEILWELKHKRDFAFKLSWLIRWAIFFGGVYLIIIIAQKYLSRADNSMLDTIILLVGFTIWFIFSPLMMYKTLKLKSFFVTKTHLVMKRYIGDTIMLPLGEFYIDITRSSSSALVGDDMVVSIFRSSIVYSFSVSHENIQNLDRLFEILKPHITEFVAALDEQEYEGCMYLMSFSFHNIYSILHKNNKQFDINEIETLYWARNVAKKLERATLEQGTEGKDSGGKELEVQAIDKSPTSTQEKQDSRILEAHSALDSQEISESTQQDCQNDEIIWELSIKLDWHKAFKLWGVRIALIGTLIGLCILYVPFLCHTLAPAIEGIHVSGSKAALGKPVLFILAASPLLIVAYIICLLIYKVVKRLNVRSIHASRSCLTLTRYIGKAIIVPTKEVFLAQVGGFFASVILSTPTNKYSRKVIRYEYIYDFMDNGCATNIADFNRLNYANLRDRLAYEIETTFYRAFQKIYESGVYDLGIKIDFDEIDSLRMARHNKEKA